MNPLQSGTVGIVPSGALGVSFFFHLTDRLQRLDGKVFFLERAGSESAKELRASGEILIADAVKIHRLPTADFFKRDLLTAYERSELPEVLLVCPNPDQLL